MLIVRWRIRRVLDWLIRKKPAAVPPATPDTDRMRKLVASVRLAVVLPRTGSVKRSWLARWRTQLLNMACRAEYHLLTISVVQAHGDGDGDTADISGLMRWTAQDMERTTAHLEDFVMLAGFALASISG